MSTVASDLPGVSGKTREAPLRFVTAASLFDGHDAAINIMRRLIQARGAEVIHLGHNRSVDDIVRAAIQEDADGIAISSYQGGHNEFFRYMVTVLEIDIERSRISLSMKSDAGQTARETGATSREKRQSPRPKRPRAGKKPAASPKKPFHNPFAEAFHKNGG